MGEGAEAVQAGVAALEDDMLQKITKPLGALGPPRMPAHARCMLGAHEPGAACGGRREPSLGSE